MNRPFDFESHALSGAYAVDALDPEERELFEQHLALCTECQLEVASLRETAGLLAETTAVTPPPALRDKVLADIRTVRPLPPVIVDGTAGGPARRWFPALVAAAVLAIVGVGAAVTQPWQDDSSEVTLSAADRVLQASDAERVALELGEAKATLVRSKSEGRAVLVTEKMPPAPAGKVYELWFRSAEGDMVPAGLMPEGTDQTVLLEGDATEASGVGITVEPAGGSEEPTTAPIALFELEA